MTTAIAVILQFHIQVVCVLLPPPPSSSSSSLTLLLPLVVEQDTLSNILRSLSFPYLLLFEKLVDCQTYSLFYMMLGRPKPRGGHTLRVHRHPSVIAALFYAPES